MTRVVMMLTVAVLVTLGSMSVPVSVSANSLRGHPASATGHVPFRHHRGHRYYYAPYYYGYGYGYGYDYGADYPPSPPAAKPVAEKPPAETRRGCEAQAYSVPSADGGESKVTILRC